MRSSAQQMQANAQYDEFMRTLEQPHTTAVATAESASSRGEVLDISAPAAAAAAASSTFTQIPLHRTAAAPLSTSSKFTWKQKQAKMHKQQQTRPQTQTAPLELQPLHPTLAAHRPKTLIKFNAGGVQLPPGAFISSAAAASSSNAAAASSSAAPSSSSSTAAAPSPKRARVESASNASNARVADKQRQAETDPRSADKQAEARPPPSAATAAAAAATAASSSSSSSAALLEPIPSASSSFRSYCVLIRNIPGSFHTADLRHFFSDLVESGRFKCFQPTHRRDEPERPLEVDVEDATQSLPPSRSASPSPAAAAAASPLAPPLTRRFERIPASISLPNRSRVSPHRPWKVMVQLRKRSDVQRLMADFQDREWVSHTGQQMGSHCRLRFVPLPKRMLRQTEKAQARASMDLTEEALDLTDAGEGATAAKEDGGVIDLTDDTPAAAAAAASSSPAAAEEDEEAETADELSASREILAAYSAGEFQAPAFLPAGLVGTPSQTVRANLAHLPPSLVRRLALQPVVSSLSQSKFAYKYREHEDASTVPAADADDDDDRLQARSRARLAEEAETAEEWDRDLAQSGQTSSAWDSGRGLGKIGDQTLFEEECEQPWDKGDASGLVHYTDAAREEAQKGTDIDERNVDMWAISDEDDEEETTKGGAAGAKQHDSDAFDDDDDDEPFDDSPAARARRKAAAAASMATRMSAAVAAASAASAAAAAEATRLEKERQTSWTQSAFLQRMMQKQGYRAGEGLGKNSQGIAQPIEAINRGLQPIGLGFKPSQQQHSPSRRSSSKSQRTWDAPAGSAEHFANALKGKLTHKGYKARAAASNQAGGFYGQGKRINTKRRWEDLELEQQ